jgi:hypothetical protein
MDFPYYVFAGEQNASAVRRAEEGAGNFIQVRGGAICEAERNFSCALASRGSTRAGTPMLSEPARINFLDFCILDGALNRKRGDCLITK